MILKPKDNGGKQEGDIFDKHNVSTRTKAEDLLGCLLEEKEQLPCPATSAHVFSHVVNHETD